MQPPDASSPSFPPRVPGRPPEDSAPSGPDGDIADEADALDPADTPDADPGWVFTDDAADLGDLDTLEADFSLDEAETFHSVRPFEDASAPDSDPDEGPWTRPRPWADVFKGVGVGLALCLAGLFLLFWSEGRLFNRHLTPVSETGQALSPDSPPLSDLDMATPVAISPENPQAVHDGRLVYVVGEIGSSGQIVDPDFGVAFDAVRVSRKVLMCQWLEIPGAGDGPSSSPLRYQKVWSSQPIPSARFRDPGKRVNPGAIPLESRIQTAEAVSLGGFRLDPSLLASLDAFAAASVSRMPEKKPAGRFGPVRLYAGGLYVGRAPRSPEVGDLRIIYTVVLPQVVSVLAEQSGNRLIPHVGPGKRTLGAVMAGVRNVPDLMAAASSPRTERRRSEPEAPSRPQR